MNERLNAAVAEVLKGRIKLPPSSTNHDNPKVSGGGRVARIRERHHTIARMVAAGMPNERICSVMGITETSLEMLKDNTPAFQELVFHYEQRGPRAEREEEYLEQKHRIAKLAQYELHDRLVEDPDSFSASELLRIQDSYDDRTGFSKQTVHVTVHQELAARLENSRRRRVVPAGAGDGGEVSSTTHLSSASPPLLELSAEPVTSPLGPKTTAAPPESMPSSAHSVSPEEMHRHLSAGRSKPMPDVSKGFKRRI